MDSHTEVVVFAVQARTRVDSQCIWAVNPAARSCCSNYLAKMGAAREFFL